MKKIIPLILAALLISGCAQGDKLTDNKKIETETTTTAAPPPITTAVTTAAETTAKTTAATTFTNTSLTDISETSEITTSVYVEITDETASETTEEYIDEDVVPVNIDDEVTDYFEFEKLYRFPEGEEGIFPGGYNRDCVVLNSTVYRVSGIYVELSDIMTDAETNPNLSANDISAIKGFIESGVLDDEASRDAESYKITPYYDLYSKTLVTENTYDTAFASDNDIISNIDYYLVSEEILIGYNEDEQIVFIFKEDKQLSELRTAADFIWAYANQLHISKVYDIVDFTNKSKSTLGIEAPYEFFEVIDHYLANWYGVSSDSYELIESGEITEYTPPFRPNFSVETEYAVSEFEPNPGGWNTDAVIYNSEAYTPASLIYQNDGFYADNYEDGHYDSLIDYVIEDNKKQPERYSDELIENLIKCRDENGLLMFDEYTKFPKVNVYNGLYSIFPDLEVNKEYYRIADGYLLRFTCAYTDGAVYVALLEKDDFSTKRRKIFEDLCRSENDFGIEKLINVKNSQADGDERLTIKLIAPENKHKEITDYLAENGNDTSIITIMSAYENELKETEKEKFEAGFNTSVVLRMKNAKVIAKINKVQNRVYDSNPAYAEQAEEYVDNLSDFYLLAPKCVADALEKGDKLIFFGGTGRIAPGGVPHRKFMVIKDRYNDDMFAFDHTYVEDRYELLENTLIIRDGKYNYDDMLNLFSLTDKQINKLYKPEMFFSELYNMSEKELKSIILDESEKIKNHSGDSGCIHTNKENGVWIEAEFTDRIEFEQTADSLYEILE